MGKQYAVMSNGAVIGMGIMYFTTDDTNACVVRACDE